MKHKTKHMIIAALCLALCLVLPFLTGQIPQSGRMLLPMHLGVFICAYVADKKWAAAVGIVAPLMRSLLFGMPMLYPTAIAMACELFTYGLVCGLLNDKLPKKPVYIYVSLIGAMLAGRIVSGLVQIPLYGLKGNTYTWTAFITASFVEALPGIILQIVLIPLLIMALRRAKLIDTPHHHDHA